MATDNKPFTTSELDGIMADLSASRKTAFAKPDAKAPLVFTRGWVQVIFAAIATSVRAAVMQARKAADEQQEQIRGLVQKTDRHAQALSALQSWRAATERKIADLEKRQ